MADSFHKETDSMNIRRFLSMVAVAALVTTGVACSSKKDESKDNNGKGKTEQTGGKEQADGKDSSTSEAPTSTVSNAEFSDSMKKIQEGIKGAAGDECKLVTALQVNPPMPGNSDQVKQMVTTYTLLLKSVADILGADTEHGKAVKAGAAELEKTAKDSGFKAGLFESEEMAKIMTGEKMTAAMNEFSARAAKCLESTTGGGDAPASSEGTPGN